MKKSSVAVLSSLVAASIAFLSGYGIGFNNGSNRSDAIRTSSSNTYRSLSAPSITSAPRATNAPTSTPVITKSSKPKPKPTSVPNKKQYVLNTNTCKFHIPSCSSVKRMNESNKKYVTKTREEIIDMGYDPCGRCNP